MIKIYTDGSCLTNPGNGGWAAIIKKNGEACIRALHQTLLGGQTITAEMAKQTQALRNT